MVAPRSSAAKPSLPARERRRDLVVKWTLAGYSTEQIAEALGVSNSAVQQDRNTRRYEVGTVRPRRTFPAEGPPKTDWLTEPPPQVVQYRYGLLTRGEGLLAEWRETNARNQLAHAAQEAEQAGDADWAVRARAMLEGLQAYIPGLLSVLADPEYRDWAARSPAARDDIGTIYK